MFAVMAASNYTTYSLGVASTTIRGVAEEPSTGKLVSVGTGGANTPRAWTSITGGRTWVQQTVSGSFNMAGLCYGAPSTGGVRFLAFGTLNNVLSSPDGVTWTARSTGQTSSWYQQDALWNGTYFIMVSNSGTASQSVRSTDGITWQAAVTTGLPYRALRIVQGNGTRLLCTGSSAASQPFNPSLSTSDDGGASWTARTLPATFLNAQTTDPAWKAAWVPWLGKYIAVGQTQATTSTDAITWNTPYTTGFNVGVDALIVTDCLIVAGGTSVTTGKEQILISTDGATWDAVDMGIGIYIYSMVWAQGAGGTAPRVLVFGGPTSTLAADPHIAIGMSFRP
jgi:hypothetical protein